LHELAVLISGYECAIYDITGERVLFDSTFQLYIELQLGNNDNVRKHWDGALLEKYSEDEAFDRFYDYLDEFKELYNKTQGQALHEILFSKYVERQKAFLQ